MKEYGTTIILEEDKTKSVCFHIPQELYVIGKQFAKQSGFKSIQQYMNWLLCRDLMANNCFQNTGCEDDDNE